MKKIDPFQLWHVEKLEIGPTSSNSKKLLAAFIDLFWTCIIVTDTKEKFWYLWFDILKKCFAIVLDGKGQ